MVKDSIYRPIYKRNEKRKHLGYDYRDNILKNSLSSKMFGVNSTLDYFLIRLNEIVYQWVESVKYIKTHVNPALDQHENSIR